MSNTLDYLKEVLAIMKEEDKRFNLGNPDADYPSNLPHVLVEHAGQVGCVIRATTGSLCGYLITGANIDDHDYARADALFDAPRGITYVRNGVVGFDCAHIDQLAPMVAVRSFAIGFMPSKNDKYVTLDEVIDSVKLLCEQEAEYVKRGKYEPI